MVTKTDAVHVSVKPPTIVIYLHVPQCQGYGADTCVKTHLEIWEGGEGGRGELWRSTEWTLAFYSLQPSSMRNEEGRYSIYCSDLVPKQTGQGALMVRM
jgi:hypothetical protein